MPARSPEEIHALIGAAFTHQNLDGFIDLYEGDATLVVPPDGLHARGRGAIATAVQPVFELLSNFRSDLIWKLEADAIALTYAHWRATGNVDGDPVEMSGKGTIVSRRQPDGSWRILLDNPIGAD